MSEITHEEFPPDVIRSPREVAGRALALFAVFGAAVGADRKGLLDWLSENCLWNEISPREHGFIDNPNPSVPEIVNTSWMSECLEVVLWCLGHIEQVPPANQQCDSSVFKTFLPPFVDISVPEFLANARLRPDHELKKMQEVCLDLHWQARDARFRGGEPKDRVDIEIIQERHRAINWICGYDNSPWDNVTTDT